MTLQDSLQKALRLHQSKQYQEAQSHYEQILAQNPNNPDALHLLGVLHYELHHPDVAVDLIHRALGQRPNFLEAKINLGSALHSAGRLEESISTYRQILQTNPNIAGLHNNLASAYQSAGKLDQAIASFRRAIQLDPKIPESHYNLANALKAAGQLDLAIASFRTAIVLKPDYAHAWSNLGIALKDNAQYDESIAAHKKTITLWPTYAGAHSNLGITLAAKGDFNSAIAAYRAAINLDPASAVFHNNLANALRQNGNLDQAIDSYQKSIVLDPSFPDAHANIGIAFKERAQLDEAIAAHRKTIALNPAAVATHSDLILELLYHPASTPESIAEELRTWNHQHAGFLKQSIQKFSNDPNPDRRLRIGYLSPDFCDHVVGRNLLPLFENHDHQQFEITCYSQLDRPDDITHHFQKLAGRWRDIPRLSDPQVATQIREDKIDILIDLAMHTGSNRLLVFAAKPAPLQVAAFAYPGTTGLPTIDYRLTDPHLDPPAMFDAHYSEKSIRLPHTFWCYALRPTEADHHPLAPLPAIKNGHITFGSLNNIFKINETTLNLWAPVLRAVPSSRLLLIAPECFTRAELTKSLQAQSIDPSRIEFAPRQTRPDYLNLYNRIDIGLDTTPYNGHTTSLDSFWMGVPVITLVGSTVVGRAGLSQLSNLNLKELAANSSAEFADIAIKLAADLPRLANLRATLRDRMQRSPLMDAPAFARDIESTYRQIWRTWCQSVLE
jgi:protein O-GlcNAc transferase